MALTAMGVLVAIVALFVGSGSDHGGDGSTATNANGAGGLVALDVQVHDRSPFDGGRAYVEVTLHNMGARLIVIDGAQVEVQRVYRLRRCASQGDIVLSQSYGLVLPVDARQGEKVEMSLHQQVGPDEADRFRLGLSTKLPESDQTSLYLFEIKIDLQNDGPQPDLPLGSVAVGLPELPPPGEYYWDSSTHDIVHNLVLTNPDYAQYLRRVAMPCWRENTAALRGVVMKSEVVSENLNQLVESVVQPAGEELE
ncbi:MAG TPA: hypothetical protein VNM38_08975 [Solirubrobacterales bacterium]|nr:hypothetical protein [Solirubrobacterales bacterium]